jgi:hypothetical protein
MSSLCPVILNYSPPEIMKNWVQESGFSKYHLWFARKSPQKMTSHKWAKNGFQIGESGFRIGGKVDLGGVGGKWFRRGPK